MAFAILNDKTQTANEILPAETPTQPTVVPPLPTAVPVNEPTPAPLPLDSRISGANFFFASQLFRHELVRREHQIVNDTDATITATKLVKETRPEIPFLLPQDQRFTQRPTPLPLTTPQTTTAGHPTVAYSDNEKEEKETSSNFLLVSNTAYVKQKKDQPNNNDLSFKNQDLDLRDSTLPEFSTASDILIPKISTKKPSTSTRKSRSTTTGAQQATTSIEATSTGTHPESSAPPPIPIEAQTTAEIEKTGPPPQQTTSEQTGTTTAILVEETTPPPQTTAPSPQRTIVSQAATSRSTRGETSERTTEQSAQTTATPAETRFGTTATALKTTSQYEETAADEGSAIRPADLKKDDFSTALVPQTTARGDLAVAEDDSDRINEIGEGPAEPIQIAAGTLDLKYVTWSPIWDSESADFYETSSGAFGDGLTTFPTIKGTYAILICVQHSYQFRIFLLPKLWAFSLLYNKVASGVCTNNKTKIIFRKTKPFSTIFRNVDNFR